MESQIYTREKDQRERVDNKIELLFGKENKTVIVPDEVAQLLHKAVYPISEGHIDSMVIDVGNGIKGKINITSKGFIKVTRIKTDTSTYEE